jgi:alpha-mannosidase
MMTALKCCESGDQFLVRFYNVSEAAVRGDIQFGMPVSEAWRATAAERAVKRLNLSPNRTGCEIEVKGGEIVTLLLRPVRRGP